MKFAIIIEVNKDDYSQNMLQAVAMTVASQASLEILNNGVPDVGNLVELLPQLPQSIIKDMITSADLTQFITESVSSPSA